METKLPMSESHRAARKKMQLARLAAKGKPGYAEMYARQPAQVAKRAANQERRDQIAEAKAVLEVKSLQDYAGAEELFGSLATKAKK